MGAIVPTVSWSGLARPSTTGGADTEEGVDAGPSPGMTIRQRPCVSTYPRSAVAPVWLVRAIATRTRRDRWPEQAGPRRRGNDPCRQIFLQPLAYPAGNGLGLICYGWGLKPPGTT